MNEERYEVEKEAMTISKVTMDRMLKEDDPASLMALYLFYYSTAKWQCKKLGTPLSPYFAWATNSFVGSGLKWGQRRVVQTRQDLERLGFIETKIKRDRKESIIGHYIRVKFVLDNSIAQEPSVAKPIEGFQQANAKETIIGYTEETFNKIHSEGSSESPTPILKSPPIPEPGDACSALPTVSQCSAHAKDGWNKMLFPLWIAKCGGPPHGGAKEVEKLCAEHGIPTVKKALVHYLADNTWKSASLWTFTSKFGMYLKEAGGPVLTLEQEAAKKAIYFAKPQLGIQKD